MTKIHFLQVKHGDAFVIECERGENRGVVVVDGGPRLYCRSFLEKMAEVGTPDLLVLTHYDDDHIGGLLKYFGGRWEEGKEPAKAVWANCAGWDATVVKEEMFPEVSPFTTCSLPQAVNLSKELIKCVNKYGMAWEDRVSEGFAKEFPFASIEVVSPTEEFLKKALAGMQMTANAAKKAAKAIERDVLEIPLDVLAKQHSPKAPNPNTPAELANGSSIGLILRCDNLDILMLGDCYPHNVEAWLRSKGYSEENPLVVDYVKVAHHGSKHNTNSPLLDIIRCNNYIISTDGDQFKHPDRESIAHILCHPRRNLEETVHLYFDYPFDQLVANRGAFLNDGELEQWNAVVHDGVTEIVPAPKAVSEPEYTFGEIKVLKNFQADDLLGLMQELNPDIDVTDKMVKRIARLGATHLFVARNPSGHIVGCASLCPYESPTGRKASVEDVVVTSACRGQGIGRRLMEEVIGYARRELAPIDLHLTSSPWRTEANELYKSLGFEPRETNVYRMSL